METNELIPSIRARAMDPETRVDVRPGYLRGGDPLPAHPLPAPARPELIAATETRLGFALPPLLRRLYAEVADGGFGPGYGLLPLATPEDPQSESLSSCYVDAINGDWPEGFHWPEKLLALWDWGCAAWSCLDCRSEEGAIITSKEGSLTATPFTLHTWIEAWAKGAKLHDAIFEEHGAARQGINPFTKQPTIIRPPLRAKGTPIAAW